MKFKHKILPMNRTDVDIDIKVIDDFEEGKVKSAVPLIQSIHLAIELIDQFFDNKMLIQIKIGCVENTWLFLQTVLCKIIQRKIDVDELNKAIQEQGLQHKASEGPVPTYDIVGEILKTLLTVASYAKLKEMEELFQNTCNMFVISYLADSNKENNSNLVFLYSLIDNIKHK